MITHLESVTKVTLAMRKWFKEEIDVCRHRIDRLEKERAKYKRGSDRDAIENLTRSIMHYEGRVLQLERSFYALDASIGDGKFPLQTPFVLGNKSGLTCGCPEPYNRDNKCIGEC